MNPLDNPVTIFNNLAIIQPGSNITILWAANRTKGCADTINGPVTKVVRSARECDMHDTCAYLEKGYCTTKNNEIFIMEHDGTKGNYDLCSSVIKNVTTKDGVEVLLKHNICGITDEYAGISIDSFKFNKKGVVIGLDWCKK